MDGRLPEVYWVVKDGLLVGGGANKVLHHVLCIMLYICMKECCILFLKNQYLLYNCEGMRKKIAQKWFIDYLYLNFSIVEKKGQGENAVGVTVCAGRCDRTSWARL